MEKRTTAATMGNTKKTPVAGKSGKAGITASVRIKDEPKLNITGEFTPH